MNWISVKDSLPIVPEDRYSISVLVCEYDSCYEELCPTYGLSVNRYASYGIFQESPEPYFYEQCGDGWIPVAVQVTHWCYLPEPPKYSTTYNQEKDRLEFVYAP